MNDVHERAERILSNPIKDAIGRANHAKNTYIKEHLKNKNISGMRISKAHIDNVLNDATLTSTNWELPSYKGVEYSTQVEKFDSESAANILDAFLTNSCAPIQVNRFIERLIDDYKTRIKKNEDAYAINRTLIGDYLDNIANKSNAFMPDPSTGLTAIDELIGQVLSDNNEDRNAADKLIKEAQVNIYRLERVLAATQSDEDREKRLEEKKKAREEKRNLQKENWNRFCVDLGSTLAKLTNIGDLFNKLKGVPPILLLVFSCINLYFFHHLFSAAISDTNAISMLVAVYILLFAFLPFPLAEFVYEKTTRKGSTWYVVIFAILALLGSFSYFALSIIHSDRFEEGSLAVAIIFGAIPIACSVIIAFAQYRAIEKRNS